MSFLLGHQPQAPPNNLGLGLPCLRLQLGEIYLVFLTQSGMNVRLHDLNVARLNRSVLHEP